MKHAVNALEQLVENMDRTNLKQIYQVERILKDLDSDDPRIPNLTEKIASIERPIHKPGPVLKDEAQIIAYLRQQLNLPQEIVEKKEPTGLQKRWELLQSKRKDDPISPQLEAELAQQEALAAQLASHASILKATTNQLSAQLQSDASVLDETFNQLDENTVRLKKARGGIALVQGSTWNTTFYIWMSVIVVVITVLVTILFMRFVGKPSHRSSPLSSPSSIFPVKASISMEEISTISKAEVSSISKQEIHHLSMAEVPAISIQEVPSISTDVIPSATEIFTSQSIQMDTFDHDIPPPLEQASESETISIFDERLEDL